MDHQNQNIFKNNKKKGSLPNKIDSELIINIAKSVKGAPGISGWSSKLINTCLEHSPSFSDFLTSLTRQISNGTASGRDYLCASRLIPLLKKNGKIRPISVGEIFYRISAKAILLSHKEDSQLLLNQYGVGSKGGTEPILLKIEQSLSDKSFQGLGMIDIKNAFNSIKRSEVLDSIIKHCPHLERTFRWSYGCASQLVLPQGDHIINSEEGLRQGDPLSPFLFSLTFRKVIEAIEHNVPNVQTLAYLDDLNLLCPDQEGYCKSISIIKDRGSQLGLEINEQKSQFITMDYIKKNSCQILGSCIGSNEGRISFLLDHINNIKDQIKLLDNLTSQESYLILRTCIAQESRHLLRSMDPSGLQDTWKYLDQVLSDFVKHLMNIYSDEPSDNIKWANQIIKLPLRHGGLGITSHSDTVDMIRISAISVAEAVLCWAPTDNIVSAKEKLKEYYQQQNEIIIQKMDHQESIQFIDLNSSISKKWLTTAPKNIKLQLTDPMVSSYLRSKTLYYNRNNKCNHCGQDNSINHSELCIYATNFKVARHELVKKSLANCLRSIGNQVNIEPFISTNSEHRADIKINGPSAPRSGTCMLDVSIVSLNTTKTRKNNNKSINKNNLNSIDAVIQSNLEIRYKQKNNHYLKLNINNNIPIIPWCITSKGTLHSATEPFLKDIKHQLIPELSVIFARSLYMSSRTQSNKITVTE